MKKYLLLWLLFITTLNLNAQLPTIGEYQALMALYSSTHGENWSHNTGWVTADPNVVQSVQGWYGITIDGSGHVTALNIHQNNLVGELPSQIGQLIYLTDLTLFSNRLSGTIPVEIGNLIHLQRFAASVNELTGGIPGTIVNMAALKNLSLDSNQLSGSIPLNIGLMLTLELINADRNLLTGSIPESIGGLINLKSIYLGNNKLSGSLPASLGDLSNLLELQLHNNQFTGSVPPEIGKLNKVGQLTLFVNQFSGVLPAQLGNMTELAYLQISGNSFTGTLPTSFTGLVKLKNLSIDNNQFSGAIPLSPSLTQLFLANNKFTFSDILPAKQTVTDVSYSNQAIIDVEKNITGAVGKPLVLSASIDRTTATPSTYQWYKTTASGTTPLNSASTDGHTVTIPVVEQKDEGARFFYTITNSAVPSLTLTSKQQTLHVVTCIAPPSLDFQFQETNGVYSFTSVLIPAEGCTVTYSWDFGDGTSSVESSPTHEYLNNGSFTAKLTATYECGPCLSIITKEYQIDMTNGGLCSSIYCDGAGGVGINTRKTQGFALSVNGKIRASDIIKVYPQTQWADFVFEKNYKLPTLVEVESFIKANGHLPGIPAAVEVEKEGIELGDMNAKLLQKIEELTLYVIESNKQSKVMLKSIIDLKKENTDLHKEVNELKRIIKK